MGLQMAQLGHAAYEFGRSHPNLDVGENIYVLSAPNEEALLKLVQLAVGLCPITIFHEPDVGGQLTAAAFGGGASKLLRKLPPAGRAQAACAMGAESCGAAMPGGPPPPGNPGISGPPGGAAAACMP